VEVTLRNGTLLFTCLLPDMSLSCGVTIESPTRCRYGLKSVFMLGVPPPTIHVHLRMIDPTDGSVPGVLPTDSTHTTTGDDTTTEGKHQPVLPGLANDEEAKAFGEWMRGRWADKETLMDGFTAANWEGFRDVNSGEAGNKEGLYGEGSVEFPIKLS
jgi:hypothetical protein